MFASLCPSRRLSLGQILLAASLLLGAVNAQIVNGGFESSTAFEGWTVEYSNYSGSTFAPWSPTQPFGHPAPTLLLSSNPQPFGTAFLPIQPYEGTQSALLNDPLGGHHATRLTQSFSPTASDIASGTLAVQWGAMLESAHPGQPGFKVEIFKNNVSVKVYTATTDDAIAEGWQVTGPGSNPDFYYKHGQVEHTFNPPLVNTDVIRVELWAWDCNGGLHGGFCCFDDARFLTCTSVPVLASMRGWWHDSTAADLASWGRNSGTWVGTPPPTSGRVGGDGLNHSGVAYVRVPDKPELNFYANSNFSIDLWVKPASVFNGLQPLVCKVFTGPGSQQLGYALYLDHGHPAVTLGDYTGGTTGLQTHVASQVVIPANEWTFLAVTMRRRPNDQVGTFYVNGTALTQTFVPLSNRSLNNGIGSAVVIPPDLLIGKFPADFHTWSGGSLVAAGPNVFDGETDEVELFRSELDPALVHSIFASGTKGKCRPAPIVEPEHPLTVGAPAVSGNDLLSGGIGCTFPLWVLGNSYSFVHVSTNGFLYLSNSSAAPGPATGFGPASTMVANLRNGAARIAPFWCDLDLQPANGGSALYAELHDPDRIVVTWKNAIEVGHTTPKTIQCHVFATGEILFDYLGSITAESGNVLCGISAGGGIADPGTSDLSASALGTSAILYQNFGPGQPFDLGDHAVLWLPNGLGYEALVEPLDIPRHQVVGTGCYREHASFYELMPDAATAAAALSGNSLTLIPTGTGYAATWTPGGAVAFLPPVGATVLNVGDDGEVVVTPSLPFPTASGPATTLRVHGNGVISFGGSPQTFPSTDNWVPTSGAFLAAANTAFWSWHDYNASEPGSGAVKYHETGTTACVTWDGVENYPIGVSNPSTVQFQLDLASGIVTIVWPSIDGNSTSPYGSAHLVGYSPGGPSLDPGSIQLATALPLVVANDLPGLTLSADVPPNPGTVVTYITSEMPEYVPGVYLGMTVISFSQAPGVDLGLIGAPGCRVYVGALDITMSMVGFTPTLGVPLAIPASLPGGLQFIVQSVALAPSANPGGLVTSNGLVTTIP